MSDKIGGKVVMGSIKVSRDHARELRLLREVWDMDSVDQVLEKLIQPHRKEKIKLLGMKQEV